MLPGFYFLLSSGSFLHCYCAALSCRRTRPWKGSKLFLYVIAVGFGLNLQSRMWEMMLEIVICDFWHDLVISMLSWGRSMNINGHSVEGKR